MSKKARAYLDYASASPISARVQRAMARALTAFGNPSAVHEEGRAARAHIDEARKKIAVSLNVKPEELVFTSGGTESNMIAIMGCYTPGMHVVTSSIEHSSILAAVAALKQRGAEVTIVDPGPDGVLKVEMVLAAVTQKTRLVTLAHVNSEIGTIQPIADIGRALKKYSSKIIFHVDAAQSPLYLDASPHTLWADLVSYDAQKLLGPKGAGVLYRDFNVSLAPLTGGGTQERGLRPGTENTLAIVGAGVAFEDAARARSARAHKVQKLRDYLIAELKAKVPEARVIGSIKRRVANNVFIAIPGADGDYLAVLMDHEGVSVSPRSACLGSGGGLSEVTQVVTGDKELARGTVRLTLGPTTTKGECDRAVTALKKVLKIALK